MTAHAHAAGRQSKHRAEEDEHGGLLGGEEHGLEQTGVHGQIGGVVERDRAAAAEGAFEHPVQNERAPDEAVRRTHQPHDLNFPTSGQDCHPDGRPDDDDRSCREPGADDEPHHRRFVVPVPDTLIFAASPDLEVTLASFASQLASEDSPVDLVALDAALEKLQKLQPRKAELIKLRFFAGLSQQEAAVALGVARSTADLDWAYAKSWVRVEMEAESDAHRRC